MGETSWNVAEYDRKKPVALIEYKARGARVKPHDANNCTLRQLADMAGLPFFIVVYDRDKVRYGILPQNDRARAVCARLKVMCEADYTAFLHQLRGRQCQS